MGSESPGQIAELLRAQLAELLCSIVHPSHTDIISATSFDAVDKLDYLIEAKIEVLTEGILASVRSEVQRILKEALVDQPSPGAASFMSAGNDEVAREFVSRVVGGAYPLQDLAPLKKYFDVLFSE